MFAGIVGRNMLRGIASRLGRKHFTTIQVTSQPPVNNNRPDDRLWTTKRLQNPTKVPQTPQDAHTYGDEKLVESININQHTVRLLERLSLVDLSSKEALETLQDSIEFASRILPINTDGVEPLYCVLEHEKLALRTDIVDDGDRQTDVLQNAVLTEEEYFIAPPGNIPLEQSENPSH